MKVVITEGFTIQPRVDSSFTEAASSDSKQLTCVIDAIHVGLTKNYSFYSEEELRKAIPTWTSPYKKPVLTHHNTYDGEPIGRVERALFNPRGTGDKGCVELIATISDPEAVQKVSDGRYSTVSIGCTVEHAYCSICGADIAEVGPWGCEHELGREYDGVLCYWRFTGITFDEVSFVNVPADEYAMVVSTDSGGSALVSTQSAGEAGTTVQLHGQGGTWKVTLEEKVAKLEADLASRDRSIEELNQKLAAKEAELAEAVSQKKAADEALSDASNKLREAEAKVEGLEREIEQVKSERDQFSEANTKLADENRRMLAEMVAHMRSMLGKEEIAIEKLLERSTESLKDTLADLKIEAQKKIQLPDKVQSPGFARMDAANAPIEGAENEKPLDLASALEFLFKGPSYASKS